MSTVKAQAVERRRQKPAGGTAARAATRRHATHRANLWHVLQWVAVHLYPGGSMASRLALARAKAQQQSDPPDRVPQRIRRHRKARDERYAKEAAKLRPENGPGSLLNDPAYHMARCAGFDVMRRDLRVPEPPTRQRNRGSDTGTLTSYVEPNPWHEPTDREPVPSNESAAWRWWKSLEPADRHAMYETSHEGEPPSGVVVLNMGLEIVNPAFVVEVW